jgi:hypothetical protein
MALYLNFTTMFYQKKQTNKIPRLAWHTQALVLRKISYQKRHCETIIHLSYTIFLYISWHSTNSFRESREKFAKSTRNEVHIYHLNENTLATTVLVNFGQTKNVCCNKLRCEGLFLGSASLFITYPGQMAKMWEYSHTNVSSSFRYLASFYMNKYTNWLRYDVLRNVLGYRDISSRNWEYWYSPA